MAMPISTGPLDSALIISDFGTEAGEKSGGDRPGDHLLDIEVSLQELAEIMGEELELPIDVATVGALRAHLAGRGQGWQALAAGRNVRAALNQRMVGADFPLGQALAQCSG